MPRSRIEPTVPSDQDATRAQEVRRALEKQSAGRKTVRVQITAGRTAEPLDLPPVVMGSNAREETDEDLSRWALCELCSPGHQRRVDLEPGLRGLLRKLMLGGLLDGANTRGCRPACSAAAVRRTTIRAAPPLTDVPAGRHFQHDKFDAARRRHAAIYPLRIWPA